MTQRLLPVSNELMAQRDARALVSAARARAQAAAQRLEADLTGLKRLTDVTKKHPIAMTLAALGAGYLLAHLLFSRRR